MAKRVSLILIFSLILLTGVTRARQTVSVVILPFRIHAQQEMAYLQKEIPLAIKKQLEQEGANVLILDRHPEAPTGPGAQPFDAIRKIGVSTGADYVILGSLTWIGQSFSLDAKLVAANRQQPPDVFSAEGRGAENLPGIVKKTVQEIVAKLFGREKIIQIVIKGNNRIEEDAIRRVIRVKAGDIYNLQKISDQLKAVYAMGYFDDIRVEAQSVPKGKIVTFVVKEKPTVRNIMISGNSWVYETDDIKDVLTLRKGSILNIKTLQSDMRRIKELYKEKNYYNANVHFKIRPRKNNQADVEYIIEEGNKLHIKKIQFVGNSAYSSKKLKSLMSTSEKDFLSWFTSAGDLNQEQLSQDVAKLTDWYQNHGYSQAQVGEPQIKYEKNGIVITIRIEEGPRYRVGKVVVAGDLIMSMKNLKP
jgi:outer membrane protein insertion porin family